MQIGNSDLDQVCEKAIVPAVKACGFDPQRVDKHNKGGLLKSEIIQYIQTADIIVADLTNERPNVYLEIGYAMGIDKFRSLILTVREDRFPGNPNYKMGGPKVHFDLAGYDILTWRPDDLDGMRIQLEKRIRRRLATTAPAASSIVPLWDTDWLGHQRVTAGSGLAAEGFSASIEVRAALHPPKIDRSQGQLRDAAREAPM